MPTRGHLGMNLNITDFSRPVPLIKAQNHKEVTRAAATKINLMTLREVAAEDAHLRYLKV
jgi:hypothetical protein